MFISYQNKGESVAEAGSGKQLECDEDDVFMSSECEVCGGNELALRVVHQRRSAHFASNAARCMVIGGQASRPLLVTLNVLALLHCAGGRRRVSEITHSLLAILLRRHPPNEAKPKQQDARRRLNIVITVLALFAAKSAKCLAHPP